MFSRIESIGRKITRHVAMLGNLIMIFGVYIFLYKFIEEYLLTGIGEILVIIISGIIAFSFIIEIHMQPLDNTEISGGCYCWIGMFITLVFVVVITYIIKIFM